MDFATIARALRLAWTRRRLGPRRISHFVMFVVSYGAACAVARIGLLADEVLFRSYRSVAVHKPVFIVAPPRSGTTLLYRLLALDTEQFTCFHSYQIALPALCHYHFLRAVSRLDRMLGGPLAWAIGRLDRSILKAWAGVHPIGIDTPEEDEALFAWTFRTPLALLLFPFLDEFPLLRIPDALPAAQRRAEMQYYVGCVKRRLRAAGGQSVFLSKNVTFPGRIESVLEAFPDARIVDVVRHPYESIPSLLSAVGRLWKFHTPEIGPHSPEIESLARLGFDYHRRMMELEKRLPADRLLRLRYEDLVRDPAQTVRRVYDHFGIPMSAEFEQALGAALTDSAFESDQRYTLEAFGLTRERIQTELPEFFEQYARKTGGPTSS